MASYVLGIDSGGTKYRVRACAPDGILLGESTGPGCSHYRFPEEEARSRISARLKACLEEFGGSPADCRQIVCGTTGYDSPEDGETLQRIYGSLEGFHCPAVCMNDVELAFRVACGKTGVLMLAGTGSICFGRNGAGETLRVGGWPAGIFGDEGSGRYIDALALRHYSRFLDGCRPENNLIREIAKITGADTRKKLMDYAVALERGKGVQPNLGAAVTRAAEAGDEDAADILEDAAECLFRLAGEAVVRLFPDPGQAFRMGIWGSVLMQSAPVREGFFRRILEVRPSAVPCVPKKDAVQGAVEIALELAAGQAENPAG